MKKNKIELGWHFLSNDYRLRYDDHRLVKKKIWIQAKECNNPVLCYKGMHASKRLFDALGFAPGSVLCRVKVRGKIKYASDKFVGMERFVVEMKNMDDIFEKFALWCYERALTKNGTTNKKCWSVAKLKKYLLDGIGGEDIFALGEHLPYDNTQNAIRGCIFNMMRDLCTIQQDKIHYISRMAELSRTVVGASLNGTCDMRLESKELAIQNRKLTTMVKKYLNVE